MELPDIFPFSYALIPKDIRDGMVPINEKGSDPEAFLNRLSLFENLSDLPPYLSELARLEWVLYAVSATTMAPPTEISGLIPNPSLRLFRSTWKNLSPLLAAEKNSPSLPPEKGEEWILLYRDPQTNRTRIEIGSAADLLVLKLIAEEGALEDLAAAEGIEPRFLNEAVARAVSTGILLRPPSKIRRRRESFPVNAVDDEAFLTSPFFTLQWHLTQACDLHCRHCYDRTPRDTLSFEEALRVLDQMQEFCRHKNVRGQISFTGGNPFLHPRFMDIYRQSARRGFVTAILGNPVPGEWIEQVMAIQEPAFFQVSLEGLPEHNDQVRQEGHFERTLGFLNLLKGLGVYSMVMLTLTRDNLDQVLPLAERLRDKTDAFFFNRLSPVGEGANLKLPDPGDYRKFMESYLEAMKENPVLGLKDNLFNILLDRKGEKLFGGCAGYGCGAAFNFLTLLPDGEVHACRKFPSEIGSILNQSLIQIYDSEQARRYRAGSQACAPCPIRPVCGGCLAVVSGLGLNIFQDRDPFCFYPNLL
jgi:selenobiotic family peptide radical SAM maturase